MNLIYFWWIVVFYFWKKKEGIYLMILDIKYIIIQKKIYISSFDVYTVKKDFFKIGTLVSETEFVWF